MTATVPSLRLISEQILRHNWIHVRDVGDCPYEVVSNVLKLSTAPQLAEIEDNSPHLSVHTNGIWKQLCVNDFVEVRKLVEDVQPEDPVLDEGSWKARYHEEDEKKQVKMKLVLEKLRSQYSELDEKKASRQAVSVDGLRMEKRRKLMSTSGSSASTRPKSLLQKARHHTKAITSIYAPKRKPVQAPSARQIPALSSCFPSSRKAPRPSTGSSIPSKMNSAGAPLPPAGTTDEAVASSKRVEAATSKRPIITTVTRTTTKRSSALLSATSPPPGPSSRHPSFSPPPPVHSASSASSFVVPPARPIAQIPLRPRAPPPPLPLSPRPDPATAATDERRPSSRSSPISPQSSPPPPQTSLWKPVPTRKPAGPPRGSGLFIPKKR